MSHLAPKVVRTPITPVETVPVAEAPVMVTPIPVVDTSNVKFRIEGTRVFFERTPEAINNQNIFETFDLARAAAIQAFSKHKNDVMAAINATEKELLVISEAESLAVPNPVTPTL